MSIHGAQWDKELSALLDQIQAHPSRDWSAERERVVVLKNLIAAREQGSNRLTPSAKAAPRSGVKA